MDSKNTSDVYMSQTYSPQLPDANYNQEMYKKIHKVENMFKPNLVDFVFALVAFALGYLFTRWVLLVFWQGWGVSAFTTLYLLAVTAYLLKKGVFVKSGAAMFWLAITWLIGFSYALWNNAGFEVIRSLFLFCSATYYIVIATSNTIMGRTGNYLLIDGINATLLVPFRNFFNQYVSVKVLAERKKYGKILPSILGIAIAIILGAILLPLLERADAGGFGMIVSFIRTNFRFDFSRIIFHSFIAIPVAAYLYGLASGAAHKKGIGIIKAESAEKTVAALRVVQPTTLNIVLGAICMLYFVFIISQMPYFFSAFTGQKPEGWLIYSEFARQGFFELCWIAAINLAILTISNITSKKHRLESRILKMFNIALAVITLVLIATAFSKMALYIGAYGLTMRRLLPCIFMVFMAIVFVALIALQKWNFSIVRFSLVVGSVIISIMCLANPDAMVVRYNADRYLNGTLHEFDMEIVRRAGSAGVLPAIAVYDVMANRAEPDWELKQEIAWFLTVQKSWESSQLSEHWLSFEARRGAEAIGDRFLPPAPMQEGRGFDVTASIHQIH